MMNRNELVHELNDLLNLDDIPEDSSNNGLQVEGRTEVRRVIGGVDACLELYQHAIEQKADFIFVHHGESWGGGWRTLTGPVAKRIHTLMTAGMSLYAAHLPLDAHPVIGHNARLAAMMKLTNRRPFAQYAGAMIGVYGELPHPSTAADLADRLGEQLQGPVTCYDFRQRPISRVGIVSGGGMGALEECEKYQIDCLITGECTHSSYHAIKERSMAVLAGGHYRTETPGVHAVLNLLHERFQLDCQFIDLPTGL